MVARLVRWVRYASSLLFDHENSSGVGFAEKWKLSPILLQTKLPYTSLRRTFDLGLNVISFFCKQKPSKRYCCKLLLRVIPYPYVRQTKFTRIGFNLGFTNLLACKVRSNLYCNTLYLGLSLATARWCGCHLCPKINRFSIPAVAMLLWWQC